MPLSVFQSAFVKRRHEQHAADALLPRVCGRNESVLEDSKVSLGTRAKVKIDITVEIQLTALHSMATEHQLSRRIPTLHTERKVLFTNRRDHWETFRS